MMRYFLFILLTMLIWPIAGHSAEPMAVLTADRIKVEANQQLIASGNVVVYYDGARLSANTIRYDRRSETLFISGPILLTDDSGTTISAKSAELSQDFKNGLIRSARMVMNEQVQLTSQTLERSEGRYATLSSVAVTSCHVCAKGEVPLWQIRATKVTHDQLEKQLYFEGAQLRVGRVPIFYLPRLRLPDPTLKRARGFLAPSARSNSVLGFGIKVPYFIPFGDNKDLTLTPFLSPKTRTLEWQYRQAFENGAVTANGAFSSDDLLSGKGRAFAFVDGLFLLRRNYILKFDIEAVSDAEYLNDYDYSDKDRLDSKLSIFRAKSNEYSEFSLHHFQSLRADEDNATQPTIVGQATYERQFYPNSFAGRITATVQAHSHFRYSNDDILGRDINRLHAGLMWENAWISRHGIRLGATALAATDHIAVSYDSRFQDNLSAQHYDLGLDVRWPLRKRFTNGTTVIIEPIAQLAHGKRTGDAFPNDESQRNEFDEANLISLSRFASYDAVESGTRGALGFRLGASTQKGLSWGLTLGRVYQETANANFTLSSGLKQKQSDLLIAGYARTPSGWGIMGRALVDEYRTVNKAEALLTLNRKTVSLDAGYLLLVQDPDEDRANTISEWSFASRFRLHENWWGSANARYDLSSDQLAKAGFGLEYNNECLLVKFSVSRKYLNTSTGEANTSFGLTVAPKGFSTKPTAGQFRKTCRN